MKLLSIHLKNLFINELHKNIKKSECLVLLNTHTRKKRK